MGLAWRRVLVIGAGCAVLAFAGAAGAVERLAVGTEFNRVFEQAPNGDWRGLGVDLVRALALRAGDTVRFKMVPWPRAQAMVAQGQADILVGPYKSPERARQFAFLDQPFYRDHMVFYGVRDGAVVWRGDYAALKNVPIAVVRGWHYGAAFDRARPGLRISTVQKLDHGALMLANGRIALLAANRRDIASVLAGLHLGGTLIEVAPELAVQDGYLAFPPQRQFAPARARYNRLLTEMVHNGELARLARQNEVALP